MQTRAYTGGWFQQSGLDLEPLYRYLAFNDVSPNTGINTEALAKWRKFMTLDKVSFVRGYLNYIEATTQDGIAIRYFEDGLYTLSLDGKDYQASLFNLENYEKDVFVPALSLFFSKGAPEPKPKSLDRNFVKNIVVFPVGPCQEIHQTMQLVSEDEQLEVVQTDFIIFLHPKKELELSTLVEMQIFFEEFSASLKEYLHDHRHIWEVVTNLKNHNGINSRQANKIQDELLHYKTTIVLNQARLKQMQPFLQLRGKAAEETEVLEDLRNLFAIKLSSLRNSLLYVQEMWNMTEQYVANALSATENILSRHSYTVLKTIRLFTALFGVNLLFRLITEAEFPIISAAGLVYVAFLVGFTLLLEVVVTGLVNLRKYRFEIRDSGLFDK